MPVRAMLLQSVAEGANANESHVIGAVVAVQDVNSSLVAKIADMEVRPSFPDPSEHSERIPVFVVSRPLDFVSAPKQAVGTDETAASVILAA